MGCHALPQGIFPTQGWNPGLPHCRQILYHLSHQGSPRILEWGGPTPSPGELPDPGTEPGFPACRQILYQLTFSPNPQYTLTPFTDGSSYLASIPVGGASLRFLWPANFNGICRKPTGPCSLPCYVSLCPSFSPNV